MLRVLFAILKTDNLFLGELGRKGKTEKRGVGLSDGNTIWRLGWSRRKTLEGRGDGTPRLRRGQHIPEDAVCCKLTQS